MLQKMSLQKSQKPEEPNVQMNYDGISEKQEKPVFINLPVPYLDFIDLLQDLLIKFDSENASNVNHAFKREKVVLSYDGISKKTGELVFNNLPCSDFLDLLQETLINFAEENALNINHAFESEGLFRQGIAAKLLFSICDRLELPHQVKFVALELFDSFMEKHIKYLYLHGANTSSTTSSKSDVWASPLKHVQEQLPLLVVSCCQIASKLNSHYTAVTVKDAQKFLSENGHDYTPDCILESELCILKTLEFKVRVLSSLDYVETLLQVLAQNCCQLDLPIAVYYSESIKLLMVLYLQSEAIYTALLNTAANMQLSLDKRLKRKRELQADKMLMGTGTIAAATFISDPQHTDEVIQQLHVMTQIGLEDLKEFVTVLVQQVQSEP